MYIKNHKLDDSLEARKLTIAAENSATGVTFDQNVNITGNLVVMGRIVTSTGLFGATENDVIEPADNMIVNGGSF